MARVRTVDFLPEIFQTSTNQQFLNATLDQLVQEPKFKKIQGFVGRRVGPGVNANDRYITETDANRANYQLEPGIVLKDSQSNKLKNSITYPGIIDALTLQGAITDNADRLFTSDYYTWDPFVDFDKFVNFSQYYWLPGGPDSVDVFSGTVPSTDNFVVTRANGAYTFSGVPGENPTITLVRGGNYTFQVAQNAKETINFRVTNQGTSAYVIDYQNNPTLTLVRGNTYIFDLSLRGPYPLFIKTIPSLTRNNVYNDGVINNGAVEGQIVFTVPQDAPDTLYYVNPTEPNLQGQMNIIDATPGTGPGFWIQTDPGVDGRIPSTPNISSRDVLGVINNGEDLGTVTFNVPRSTAQNFYYTLTPTAPVDLVTDLKFNQINNQFVVPFLEQYGGIDGITGLDGKTIVFLNQIENAEDGGWQKTTQFDPLAQDPANNGAVGSFDTTLYDQTTDIPPNERYSVYQIRYVTTDDGTVFMRLNNVRAVDPLEKFSILYGTQYSSTEWFKNAEGYFEQIPLLTAVRDTLFYQDGTDPKIFGRIKLINQDQASTLDISDILGRKNYTSPNGVVFSNGLKVQFIGSVDPASYQNKEYYVEGVGTAIKLLPVTDFVTPETYTKSATVPYDSTPFDVGNYDASLNQPLVPDYLTINRASPDLNAWTRSNRWFHIDIINATAEYNNTVAVIDNNFRAKRPILEYRAGTRLFDFGTEGKQPVNIIDFNETDAFSNINGQTEYSVDGYDFINGSRVIFAADEDPQVRNKIYVVEFITPDSVSPLIDQPVINLVPAEDSTVLLNQTVVCLSGTTLQGISFYFDGLNWIQAQEKSSVNQPPLFDVYDNQGFSLGSQEKYPSTNFKGSKLFSYAVSSGSVDPVLGFALRYLSLTNVGDIVFDNNLYVDQFTYTKDSVSNTENISIGSARQYLDRVNYLSEIGWQPAVTTSITRQQFRFSYDGNPLELDIKVETEGTLPGVQLYVGSKFQEPNTYEVATTDNSTVIRLLKTFAPGDIIEVNVISNQTSKVGFYEIPVNLENNPLNQNSSTFTLGTVRSHYETIGENLKDISGPINGANNTRDLGNIGIYGTNILQQSSPLTMAGYFMRSDQFNIFNALEYNSREYEKFKAQLLDTVIRNDYTNFTIPQMLTAAIADITIGRTEINPFYWSDMLPASSVYTETVSTYTPISVPVFDLTTTYDFTSSNYKSVLVYVNDELLTYRYDYTVAQDAPTLTITRPLVVGDVIKIQEYATTVGNFVPNTPTKMGLYPAFRPEIYLDTTYINPTLVIQGHDGSKTLAFGDFRDQLLLEFETRIYNNLKIKSEIPLTLADVVPGQFRTTDYTLSEINQILSRDFLSWIGWNKLDYKQQDYIANNEFTWNYSASGNKLTGVSSITESALPVGAWRGIYRYFYDTDYPDTRPWEMLGFSEEPAWWEDRYGPAPYTSGNLVLWDDLAQGRVADPAGEYFLPQYARPRLDEVIPVNSEGQLLSPFECVVGGFDSTQFQKSWTFGDGGPVEATWFKSSSYPFAVMRLLALTRPAEFFSLFADRDLYKFNEEYNQYLYNNRYRLDANGVQVYGNGVSKASFINWIVDYNQQLGRNSTDELTVDLQNLDVRLCYRLGSFTDKQYLKIYTEKSSPNSLNSSLLLPDESYNLLLYKNQPFDRVVYSSVIVQIVDNGYAVYGYSITQPYFNILASRTAGTKTIISSGGSTVEVPDQYTDNVVQVPYGYVFTNQTVVVDFLLSYGALLESQGVVFDNRENGRNLDWNQMAQEFLYWADQGWAIGSVINLNPAAPALTVYRPGAIVDSVIAQTPENLILDQNRTTLPVRNLVVDRVDNTFKVSTLNEQTISYLDLRFTSYENLVVLDNVSIFNDLIYDPVTGARQSRINVNAAVSADWNGQVDAQGFILNNNATVEQWQPNRKYAKGEIVLYKNNYWSAQTIVQPKAEFNYSDWVKSDYTKIQSGLLENIPNKANQLANSYNTNTANLESDQDLLSYGLIGFRPREYMTSLNLDDISQVNVYQQFLKNKGTIRSVRLLGTANLGKEVAEYNVYENWAVQKAVYGANANKSFVEFRLNEALLESDPSVIQVINPGQESSADQTILLENIWRQSFKIPNTNIFPTTLENPTDSALPSAGYVNLEDVDVTVFSLLGDLGFAPGVLDTIGVGTTIWAAKSNTYDWNVYRSSSVPGRVININTNLDTTSTATFSQGHGLVVGDIVVIRFFDDRINGIYRVLAVPDLRSIVIDLNLVNSASGNGLAYRLQTMRVAQASDTVNLPYVTEMIPGSKVWVDNDGQGLWTVIEKQNPFASEAEIQASPSESNAQFGASVAQGQNNVIALIGSPGYSTTGAVYPYLQDSTGNYVQSNLLTLDTANAAGYGNAVEIGNTSWAVAGASRSNNNQGYATVIYRDPASGIFDQTQLLVAPDQDFGQGEFGYSVSISEDERWMFVGAPGHNKVYAYGKVDVETQIVRYTTDGSTSTYSFNNQILISDDRQLNVVLNNQLLSLNIDYTVSGNNIVLSTTPPADQSLIINRKVSEQLDHNIYTNVTQNSTSGSGTGAEFTIDRTRGTYTTTLTNGGEDYNNGDTITILATAIDGGTVPANNLTITVVSTDINGSITSFTTSGSGVSNTSVFEITPFLYSVTDINSFSVRVNNVPQRPFIDYDFNSDSATDFQEIVFINNPPAGATIIVTAGTYFDYVSTISVTGLPVTARFGQSLATSTDGRQVLIGCSNHIVNGLTDAGSVYAFDRSVIRYIIDDPDQLEYSIPAGSISPVSVLLNNAFLNNSDQFINGQFTVDLLNNTVTLENIDLSVGDVLEIEVNIFNQIQNISANAPFQSARFGSAVDLCSNNCSLYIGAPNDGTVVPGAGSVDRRVNQARVYGVITSTVTNPALNSGDTIRINNTPVAVPNAPNNTVAGLAQAINASGIPNVQASTSAGLLTISVINLEAADQFNRLNILPGVTGSAWQSLGFDLYAFTQNIVSPNPTASAAFGSAVFVDSEADNLVVGAPQGDVFEPVTFDAGTTYFDDRSTTFSSTVVQSGVVYTFDYLPSANDSISNPGKFVFGQQIYDSNVKSLDRWGSAVNYTTGRLLVGSPGSDLEDSTYSDLNYGRVGAFNNPDKKSAWTVIRQQKPVGDVYLLNGVFMYDRLQSARTQFFDFFNPLQGKILGAARQNIDYITAVDPAKYNFGPVNNNGNFWATDRVGEIWWDINSVRFIDPNQDDITYASRRWGQVFPGSRVDVYQWVESTVPPTQYTGPGTPYSTTSYTVNSRLSNQGIFETLYYFWVTGIDSVAVTAGKTLSTTGIARYIESPRSSGIPYIALLNENTVAIYNGLEYISAADTILHIDYDREYTDANVHVEYELVAEGIDDSFLSANLYRKLQDSFCGVNSTGALVPDLTLSPPERYGVQFRPRQSMFADRFAALENYLVRANNILKNYPIVETRRFTLLNSQEPEPTEASGEWDKRLANIEQLSYQNLDLVPVGYTYLVTSDSTNNGLWTIYTVIIDNTLPGNPKTTQLTRVQTYDTRKYWFHIDWYQPGYNSSVVPVAEVPNYASLATISVPVGSSVKVTRNAQGKFEIYLRTETGWDRVGLEDGTIQFSNTLWDYQAGRFGFDVEVFDAQYFDQEPTTETRKIIQAINEELFIDDLAIERNRSLILMFNFILSEFTAPEWLTKTSLIDVNHRIRELVPFQIYRQDNQEFVLDYIQEVKPYHVQIKEFNLTYDGFDDYQGLVSDFDVPAYFNTALTIPQYTSPILLPYTKSTAVGTGTPNTNSDTPANADIWDETPWNAWYDNYLLSIESVNIIDGGIGYTVPPEVVITGTAQVPAEMTAIINTAGQVVGVNIVNPGQGYVTTAVITFVGGNGIGARAAAVMGNDLIRSIKTTIKYDRYEYSSDIVDWQAGVSYSNGTQVRYNNQVWQADSSDSTSVESTTFDPEQWLLVNSASLSGVNRTRGYYTPGPNEPGLDLPLLIDGIDYPGVQVYGTDYDSPITLSELDTVYESPYLDPYLGTRTTDINVDGGAYVDTYSSHAPEELIPGAEFDTLDFRVYTRPGSDWANNGHGFASYSLNIEVNALPVVYDFSVWYDFVPYLVTGTLFNRTTGVEMIIGENYTVDWVSKTFTVTSGANPGDVLIGTAYGLGGGNQLYRQNYLGSDIGNTVTIPVQFTQIQEVVVWVNGQPYKSVSIEQGPGVSTVVNFGNTFTFTDHVVLYAFGPTSSPDGSTELDYSWSAPVTQLIVGDGSTLSFDLDNSLEYTNPVNLIVTVNGVRARTAAGAEYYADDSTAYPIPERLGFSQSLIANNEVFVYANDILLVQDIDYFVEPWTGDQRNVVLITDVEPGSRILVAVTTGTQCYIDGNQLVFDPTRGIVPVLGDQILVTTWNDTRQQNILTTVIVGPTTTGVTITEGYDDTDFSPDTLNFEPGSFDYSEGSVETVNNIQLGRVVTDPSRLWVTVDRNGSGGNRLFFGDDFIIQGQELVLSSGILNPNDVVMVTQFTDSIVPNAMAFRIFQDMRGVQATYRITESTTTTLTQPLSETDDIIYVDDVNALGVPDLAINIWGVLSIDGERIMYRNINYDENTVSGLRRGTAGTAINSHAVGALVYDMGRGNIMPAEFQNYVLSYSELGDGIQTTYVASDITEETLLLAQESVEVYVGGTRQSSGYTVTDNAPVTVVFDTAPTEGVEVTVLVRRGVNWYEPGAGTPSNGVALQDTNTQAARFLRGL